LRHGAGPIWTLIAVVNVGNLARHIARRRDDVGMLFVDLVDKGETHAEVVDVDCTRVVVEDVKGRVGRLYDRAQFE
jgi:hypothetical protein